ncbi:ABC transporter [Azospirillum argentinense]|uniref:ABC transporter n=2 Tax=Azospirillum TaxID=191 RepID=A0A2K1FQK7_9PROT|nr:MULTISPECIES: ABC transporter permease [Azospirillum]AIB12486.1 ABC transporter [Azospirillum argentinense]EZQ09295.1 ABC transporter [Azospirillum argentinense]KAA1056421.1 ABC transporter, permease protein 1 (cluster 5, nickel/peptides/opines) [Azospirillum argentinense]MBK3802624.1 ABC transporter permease subunit [Azospirillum argentinense]NUB13090.1 ABC transporter permease subunit [Azospirillum brasilense]
MLLYTLTRLAYLAMVLVVMSILVFLVTQAMPGDVASMIAGQFASKEVIDAITVKLGLDQPLIVQYGRWAAGILQGDLGRSLVLEQPVAPILMEALSRSLVLAVVALAVVTVIGIGAGVLAAVRRGRMADQMVSGVSYLGIAVPDFFWAIVLVLVFGSYLKWLPTGGYAPLADGFVPWASHLVLPVVTLVLMLIARIARLTRSSMIDVLQTNYVKYARAKGLPEKVVIVRHALRNALLPTITVLAIDFGLILGGVVVIETVFSFPGMGRLLLFAIQRHDLPLIQATILIISTAYCLANLAADLLYAFVNPKIRHGMGNA